MKPAVDVIIRNARSEDLPEIVTLMNMLTITTSKVESKGASTLADYEDVFEKIDANPSHHLLVAEVNGRITGTAHVVIVPNLSHRGLPWAVLENLIVDESMRKKGIARALLRHAIETSKQNGCYKIGLSSNKKRTAAHRLYESVGFKQYGFGYRIYF